jgi:microcystin-dependent protein
MFYPLNINNNQSLKWILLSLFGLMILSMISTQYLARKPISTSKDGFTTLTNYTPDKILFSDYSGNATFQAFDKYYIPPNTIVMWFNEVIPSGWAECNGQNGTPDLRGRFPLAFNNSQGATANSIGKTGGEERVILNDPKYIPSHTHTGTTNGGGYGTDIWYRVTGNDSGANCSNCGQGFNSHSHTFTTNPTGGNQSHENMPPYYVLKFIIKL